MKKIVKVRSDEEALKLFGNLDQNISFAESRCRITVSARGHKITLNGDEKDIDKAYAFFHNMLRSIRRGETVSAEELEQFMPEEGPHHKEKPAPVPIDGAVFTTYKGKAIQARSKGQEKYVNFSARRDIIFSIGPAGTGKTYLAVAIALAFLKRHEVARIILTRPAVEAGESLGFLPGDMYAKINPYLRPLYDALYEMIGFDEVARCIEKGIIEIAPLAFMRGRTLNDAFIILDEAQNSTPQQMKMFLTRLGFSSKCIITGDITQIDLRHGHRSGLVDVQAVLEGIEGIQFVYLDEHDVVRHQLVKDIIKAYEKDEKKRTKRKNRKV